MSDGVKCTYGCEDKCIINIHHWYRMLREKAVEIFGEYPVSEEKRAEIKKMSKEDDYKRRHTFRVWNTFDKRWDYISPNSELGIG